MKMFLEILKVLEIAKRKKFRYILLNTNGLRIAEDENFVKELSKFRGRFEKCHNFGIPRRMEVSQTVFHDRFTHRD